MTPGQVADKYAFLAANGQGKPKRRASAEAVDIIYSFYFVSRDIT
jgi:hypothetical protein